MCGIAGWIDWEVDVSQQLPVVAAMSQTLSNRGPDADGIWASPHCALAHRRLIVVDPEGGGQPMVRSRGQHSYVIIYNGELYNTAELRQELESRGYRFGGYSDTEVLLVAFIEWGPACVERLNGIFAFGIWNEAEQSLFLARDRLGVKPLFYAQRGSAFLFASELKAILAHPAVEPVVDAEGLAEVFGLGPGRTPGCGVFRGIKELKPGYMLTHDRRGTRIQCYWSLVSHPHEDDLETAAATVRRILRDSVERQLVADVPVCVLLSGGIDSSAIAAFASHAFEQAGLGPLSTFSVDYPDNERHFQPNQFQPATDAPFAQMVSGFLGTRHEVVLIDTPGLVAALKTAVRARDLPGMADVDASLYLFSCAIKERATVALSGESADEVFGGYPWFFNTGAQPGGTFPWVRMLEARERLLAPDLLQYIRPREYAAARYQEALAEVPRLPGEDPEEARQREMLYLNITRFMPILLDRKDRMSMATGLEVRVPFCDHRLVEYVWNIPMSMKACDQMAKGILRRALAGLLPEAVLTRCKNPYPKTHHPAYHKAVRDWLAGIVADPASPLRQLLNMPLVREVVRSEAAAFNPAWFSQLMGGTQLLAYLAQVDTWLREYHIIIR